LALDHGAVAKGRTFGADISRETGLYCSYPWRFKDHANHFHLIYAGCTVVS
jgi:hypothetical protein